MAELVRICESIPNQFFFLIYFESFMEISEIPNLSLAKRPAIQNLKSKREVNRKQQKELHLY